MHESRNRIAALAGITVVLAAVALPTAANAAGTWGPLTVSVNGHQVGDAHGTASVNSEYIKNASTYEGVPSDPVRVETTWEFYKGVRQADGSNVTSWNYDGRSDTPTRSKTSLITVTNQDVLDPDGLKARAEPRLCSPRPIFVPVPCSNYSIKTFDY